MKMMPGKDYNPTVQLRQAFEWTCPDCGRDSFVRAVHIEDPEMIRECEAELGTGDLVMAPSTVHCLYCDETFDTGDADEN